MQNVKVERFGNILNVYLETNDDCELISKPENIKKIKNALIDVADFEIKTIVSSKEKMLSEIDSATEKIKKIFGDDIVVIKD